mmetsp:Transcript_5867/g.7482  ORF Transcript_5867/g.7482 Transcript_5867/m.7482 type:complete len:193 (+) Transcript_5867:20-598(+)
MVKYEIKEEFVSTTTHQRHVATIGRFSICNILRFKYGILSYSIDTRASGKYWYKRLPMGVACSPDIIQARTFPDGETAANCEIHKNNKFSTILVHCKGQRLFISFDGIYGEFQERWYSNPSTNLGSDWNWGSNTVYVEGDDMMYFGVSRCQKPSAGKCNMSTRTVFIYKLNEAWTDFVWENPVVTEWNWPNR